MASRLLPPFLAAALLLLAAQTITAQSTQPEPPPVVTIQPPALDPSPDGLTPAQRRAILQLLDVFLGEQKTPLPAPTQVIPPLVRDSQPNVPPVPFPPANPQPTPDFNVPMKTSSISPSVSGLRFTFKIDPKTPDATLLPTPPKALTKLPLWTNEDLAKTPEVTIGEPISKNLDKVKALEASAHLLAKVNHLNAKKTDGFMLALIESRTDIRGLPFLMGDECRTRGEQAKVFHNIANTLNEIIRSTQQLAIPDMRNFLASHAELARAHFNPINHEEADRAIVAALTQILMPESPRYRVGLAKYLAQVQHVEATKALARMALYSPEDEVRAAAIDGLKLRRERDYTPILLEGFNYPLPAVSKRAAEAFIKLERTDVAAKLIEVLERPDPRLPVTEKRDGKDVTFVREMVKINHHKNCALCHAPGNTEAMPDGVLTVAVPLPNEPLPKPSQGGYQSTPPPSPDVVVRIDMTYLRQDFSVMMPVADAHPWPEMQRFDFLVRTRVLTPTEAQAYEPCCDMEEPGRLSPYHRSALFALRELTGRDAEPTPAAWRKLLRLPKSGS